MTTVRNLDIAAMSTEQAVTEISNLAKQRGTILTQKEAEAVYSHILALRGQTVATNAATVAQEGLNTAMSINPIGIILVALTALITTIALYTSNLEKVRKQKIENAKADLEELKNTRNEIRENEKLLQSYDNLYYKFKQNEATKEELQIQTEQLLEKYDNEIDKIALLAENYDKLEESIRAARLTELEKEEINVNDQIKDTNLLIQEQQRKTGVTQGYSLFIPEGITTLQQFDASGSTETLKRNDLSEQDVLNRIKDKNAYYWNVNTGFSTKDDEFFKEELLRSGFFDIAVQDVGNAKFYFKPELVTDEETYVQTLKSLEEYVNKIKEEYKDLG